MSEGDRYFCENYGTRISQTANFCPKCGAAQHPDIEEPTGPLAEEAGPRGTGTQNAAGPSVTAPHNESGRIPVSEVPGVPPPPTSATAAQDGLGRFLRSFGLGAGARIGMAVALTLLLVLGLVGGAALISAVNGKAGEEGSAATNQRGEEASTSATANAEKREAPSQGSLDNLIPEQVGDFTLETSEPWNTGAEASTDSKRITYKSSEGIEVTHMVGFVTPKYANDKGFAEGYLKSFTKPSSLNELDLGGEPERSDFEIKDESGKQVGRGVLLLGTENDFWAWTNGRLTAALKVPKGYGQDFYNELPY